jgi:hypothetical protein
VKLKLIMMATFASIVTNQAIAMDISKCAGSDLELVKSASNIQALWRAQSITTKNLDLESRQDRQLIANAQNCAKLNAVLAVGYEKQSKKVLTAKNIDDARERFGVDGALNYLVNISRTDFLTNGAKSQLLSGISKDPAAAMVVQTFNENHRALALIMEGSESLYMLAYNILKLLPSFPPDKKEVWNLIDKLNSVMEGKNNGVITADQLDALAFKAFRIQAEDSIESN